MKNIIVSLLFMALLLCSCDRGKEHVQTTAVTAEMALEGITNYCHSGYDRSAAEDNPNLMSMSLGKETDSAYYVVFRSYTGALVNFYVDKTNGSTRMQEYVPALDITSEAGTIDLFDYLEKED